MWLQDGMKMKMASGIRMLMVHIMQEGFRIFPEQNTALMIMVMFKLAGYQKE